MDEEKKIKVTTDQALMMYYGMIDLRDRTPIPSPLALLRSHRNTPVKIAHWSMLVTEELEKIARVHGKLEAKINEKYPDEKDAEAKKAELAEAMAAETVLPFDRIVIDLNTFPDGILSGDDMMRAKGIICEFTGAK
jgi:hypothetical protein